MEPHFPRQGKPHGSLAQANRDGCDGHSRCPSRARHSTWPPQSVTSTTPTSCLTNGRFRHRSSPPPLSGLKVSTVRTPQADILLALEPTAAQLGGYDDREDRASGRGAGEILVGCSTAKRSQCGVCARAG